MNTVDLRAAAHQYENIMFLFMAEECLREHPGTWYLDEYKLIELLQQIPETEVKYQQFFDEHPDGNWIDMPLTQKEYFEKYEEAPDWYGDGPNGIRYIVKGPRYKEWKDSPQMYLARALFQRYAAEVGGTIVGNLTETANWDETHSWVTLKIDYVHYGS